MTLMSAVAHAARGSGGGGGGGGNVSMSKAQLPAYLAPGLQKELSCQKALIAEL